MTTALWCVLIAAILPIVSTGLAKSGARDFDNANPREWQGKLDGWRARAHAAHNNGLEAFPLFAVAVLVATTQGGPKHAVDLLAVLWVAARLGYTAAYLADWPTLRSVLFTIAFFAATAIFVSPLWA